MRLLAPLLAAALLVACSEADVADLPAGSGWTVQIVGDDANQVFLVSGPDGKEAAARVTGGTSTLIAAREAQGFLAAHKADAANEDLPEKVAIQAPGFSVKVAAEESGEGGGAGRVSMKVGGIEIDAGGAGEGEIGSGAVRIAGLDADGARKFIDESEDLSAETKAQMRARLGL